MAFDPSAGKYYPASCANGWWVRPLASFPLASKNLHLRQKKIPAFPKNMYKTFTSWTHIYEGYIFRLLSTFHSPPLYAGGLMSNDLSPSPSHTDQTPTCPTT